MICQDLFSKKVDQNKNIFKSVFAAVVTGALRVKMSSAENFTKSAKC